MYSNKIRFLGVILAIFISLGAQNILADTSIVINEVQNSNDGIIADEDGDFSDWIELFNPTQQRIDISSFGLSDSPGNPTKWVFPQGTYIDAGKYLVVFASSKNRKNPSQNLHTNFNISADGETITLADRTATVIDVVTTGALVKGQSIGRKPNGSGSFVLFTEPTPGSANQSTPLALPPVFSLPAGFYSDSQTVTLSTDQPDSQINYSLFKGFNDIGEPIVEEGLYSGPITISKTTVVRAWINRAGFDPSAMVANTYFINFDHTGMPVTSLTTDRDNLFDPVKGIYIKGENAGGVPNYLLDEERPVYFEFFDDNGHVGISQNAGLAIQGNSSRELLPRSLSLFARKIYKSPGSFKHAMFPKKLATEYEGFALRNDSQDGARLFISGLSLRGTFLRNGILAELNRSLGVDFRDSRHTIVFIDGEYWGMADVQERFNSDFVSENHPQVDPLDVDLLVIYGDPLLPIEQRLDNEIITRDYFGRGIIQYEDVSRDGKGIDDYLSLVTFMQGHNLSDPNNYAYVKDRLDIATTINYFIVQIYSGDLDWPNNNVRIWRDSKVGTDGLKGKWHYVFSDSDYTFNLIPDLMSDNNTLEHAALNSIEFKALLQNEEFKQAFIAALTGYLNGPLKAENVLNILAEKKAKVQGQIPAHLNKWWGGQFTVEQWESNVENIRQFILTRQEALENFAQKLFSLNGKSQLTFQVEPSGAGQIVINEVPITEGEGSYFNGVPLNLKPKTNAGYDFVGWQMDGQTVNQTALTVIPSGNKVIVALFALKSDSPLPDGSIVINEAAGSVSGEDWIELKNIGSTDTDIKGLTISDGSNSWVFPQSHVIPAGGYIVIFADSTSNDLHTNFNISSAGESISLKDVSGKVLDSVSTGAFTRDVSNGRLPDGTGVWKIGLPSLTQGSINIAPTGNQSPVISDILDVTLQIGQTRDVTITATDFDGDNLTYTATSNPSSFTHFTVTGNTIHLAPQTADAGVYAITVNVDDGQGHQVSKSFNFTATTQTLPPAQLVINEVAGSVSGSDWIELKNIGGSDADIQGLTISDGSNVWTFAQSHVIPASGYIVIFADSTNSDLHTNFNVSSAGETLTLKDAAGTVLDTVSTGAFVKNISNGRILDGTGVWTIGLPSLTQGTANVTPTGGNQAPVVTNIANLSVQAGQVQNVTITATDADGDALTYTATSNPSSFTHFTVTGNTINFAPLTVDAGVYTITVNVDDGHGHVVTKNFTLIVTTQATPLAQLVINEAMASNQNGIVDPLTGAHEDWFELKNVGTSPVNIQGFSIICGVSDPAYVFPDSYEIPAGGYLLIWADHGESGNTHTNFNISKTNNETMVLKDVSGVQIDSVVTGLFGTDISNGRNPDGTGAWTIGLSSVTPGTANIGTVGNQAPVVSNIANVSVQTGQTQDVTISATDADGDALTYTATSNPTSFTHMTVTGSTIHLAPVAGEVGTYTITVSVNDGHNAAVTKSFTLTVTTVAVPVVNMVINEAKGSGNGSDWIELKNIGSSDTDIQGFTISDGGNSWVFTQSHVIPAGGYVVVFADSTSSDLHTNFNLSAAGEPITLKDASGTVLDTVVSGAFGTNISNGRSPDGTGSWTIGLPSLTQGASNTPVVVNQAPVMSNIANLSVEAGQTQDVTISATDADGDTLTYTATSDPAIFSNFTVSGNIIHLAPIVQDIGVYTISVNVNDGHGHLVSKSFTLTVTAPVAVNHPPVITNNFSDISMYPGETRDVTITATDQDGNPLTYSATGYSKMSVTNNVLHIAPLSDADFGFYTITVTVKDGLGGEASKSFNLTVYHAIAVNQAPVVSPINDVSVQAGQTFDVLVSANDPDGDTLTYTATSNPVSFTNFTVNGSTIHLAPVSADVGSYTLTVNVNDGKGHVVPKSFILTVTAIPVAPQAMIVINEAMGSNTKTLLDPLTNNYADWFELVNVSNASVNIQGYSITCGNKTWVFPNSYAMAAGEHLLIWADSMSSGNTHTNFNISKTNNEIMTLKDASSNQLDSVATGVFVSDISNGRNPDGTGTWGALANPTPGVSNS